MSEFSKEDLVKFRNENLELTLFLSTEQCYEEMKKKTSPAQEVLNKPSEILNDGCYKAMTDNGSRYYSKDNQLHRKDGPAIEYVRGEVIEEWYLNGLLHRENGPARMCSRSRHWYKNGQRHREDGPAREWDAGGKEWYLNGKQYTEEEFNKTNASLTRLNTRIIAKSGAEYYIINEKIYDKEGNFIKNYSDFDRTDIWYSI